MSRTYDILGNTLTNGAKTMAWDELNRMLSFNPGPGGQATMYVYRADGMRVRKGQLASPNVYTEYAYDGQMPIEEYNYRSVYPVSFIKVIRYGLGARGVDYIEKVPANGPLIVGYPIYDDHGNMIATLGKNGVLADQRSYDAWGVIRSGNTTGEPHGQYCANLGHLADDESGLIYMRARYYDAESGRFISEDPASNGVNFFHYCQNNPVNRGDSSGEVDDWLAAYSIVGDVSEMVTLCAVISAAARVSLQAKVVAIAGVGFLAAWFGVPGMDTRHPGEALGIMARIMGSGALVGGLLQALAPYYNMAGSASAGASAIAVFSAYSSTLLLFLVACNLANTLEDL